MAKIYFIQNHLVKNLTDLVAKQAPKFFHPGEKICLKLHMGEYGNLNYVRPSLVELVVSQLKKIKTRPFLFDSPVAYSGQRETVDDYLETARRNGFSEETMGCPIIVSNKGTNIKSKHFSKIVLSKPLIEADGMVVISHFKGHELTVYGGAIKNLGMGAVTKATKSLLHNETQVGMGDINNCTGCGACVKICPERAISLKNNKVDINYSNCFGCCACAQVCPSQVLFVKNISLSCGLAEVTKLIVNQFGPKKILYINILLDIVKTCDCYPIAGSAPEYRSICPNIGILLSDDPVAIDRASLDLVNQNSGGQLGKIWPADPDEQTHYGAEIGLGSESYNLINYPN